MSEHLRTEIPAETRLPSSEELKAGFFLGADEKVAFAIPTSTGRVRRSIDIGNGVQIEGQTVAELRFGGTETFATGLVVNTHDGLDRRSDVLVVYSPNEGRTFSTQLTPGETVGIGRDFAGQDMLPGTVSRDHCAVGLDENNQLVIENHNPTNTTAARVIG